jgi:hypothetical protein
MVCTAPSLGVENDLSTARETASTAKAAQITAEGLLGQALAEKKNLTEAVRKLKEDMQQLQHDLDTERGKPPYSRACPP